MRSRAGLGVRRPATASASAARQGKAAHKRRRHVLSSLAAVAWEHLACALANRDQHKEPSLFSSSLCKNSDTWATGGAPTWPRSSLTQTQSRRGRVSRINYPDPENIQRCEVAAIGVVGELRGCAGKVVWCRPSVRGPHVPRTTYHVPPVLRELQHFTRHGAQLLLCSTATQLRGSATRIIKCLQE